jgi:hypothetical protein
MGVVEKSGRRWKKKGKKEDRRLSGEKAIPRKCSFPIL